MAKKIIGLIGEKASGKGTVAEYLSKKYAASVHTFSSSMKQCVKCLGLPPTRENLIKFSVITREAYGEDLYAKVIAKASEKDTSEIVVVDGIRREADISILGTLPGFHLLYITGPVELRHERAKKRGEKPEESTMTFEQFVEQENAPTELDIARLGEQADEQIDNTGSLEDLYARIDEIIRGL